MKTKSIIKGNQSFETYDFNYVIKNEGIYVPVEYPQFRVVTLGSKYDDMAFATLLITETLSEPLLEKSWGKDKFTKINHIFIPFIGPSNELPFN